MADAQRYQIQHLIAAGGMAEVYLGESAGIEGFRKKVAIKRVLPKLSENQDFINMFLDEARLCAYLSHSKCVQVFDIGQGAGSHFIVMEYVDGADLRGVLDHLASQNKAVSVETACFVAMQICEGLAYAHSACDHRGNPLQIVHRDISPHNVLMTRHGEVKLVDFGLAKASSHLSDEDEDIVKGKFGYLAPEVTLRLGADHRVDVFAVGILIFEMLASRRLFLGKTDLETFKQVQAAEIPDLRKIRPDVDDNLLHVVHKALARDRDARYQSADELARDLAHVLFARQRPVTYQDLAKIVQATALSNNKQRKRAPQDTRAVIGELILDAVHAFSQDDGQAPSLPRQGGLHSPLSVRGGGKYEDPTAWGLGDDLDELLSGPPPARAAAAPAAPSPTRAPVASPKAPLASAVATSAAPAAAAASRPAASGPSAAAPRPVLSVPSQAQTPAASPGQQTLPATPAPPLSAARARMQPSGASDQGGPWWKRWF